MRHRILIIEDNEESALVLKEYLSEQGFLADVAINGVEALYMFKQKPYHLLLTDFKLPDIDGHSLVEKCKKISENFKVVYLTGYDIKQNNPNLKIDSDCQIIEKPSRPRDILKTIKKML